jgi:hypothetical protein
MSNQSAAIAAIKFTLETDGGIEFLRCWSEGDFESIRKEWPSAPESVFDGADPLYKKTSVKPSQIEDMKAFLLNMAKELNLDEGHTFPIRLLMTKMTRMNPKEKEAIEPAFDSLVIDGIFEKRDDSYFLTENGKNTIY